MRARLIIVSGNAVDTVIQATPPVVIGRGREADIKLLHSQISRQHCEITEVNGKLHVRDLGSMNGTLVDDAKVSGSALLPSGSLLTVGGIVLRVEYEDGTGTMSDARDGTTVSKLSDLVDEPSTELNRSAAPWQPPAQNSAADVINFDDLDDQAILPHPAPEPPTSDSATP